jgi:hypothetical protein
MGFTLPGMVTPTFDVEELEKRIKDMKAVEGWLRMNLSMLQMTIQGLEMQLTTVGAVKAMGQMASDAAKSMSPGQEAAPPAPPPNFFEGAIHPENASLSEAAMWPWQMMQQMREQMQHSAEAAAAQAASAQSAEAKPKTPRASAPKK